CTTKTTLFPYTTLFRSKNEGCLEENIFKDKFTGTKRDRPNFNKVLDVLQEGDTLVVTKLDRFARSSLDGINIIRDLFERGIKVQDRKSTRLNSSHVKIS